MPYTLNISWTAASPAPANGYRVKYWPTSNPANITTVSPNVSGTSYQVTGLVEGSYAGTVESDCGGGNYSSVQSFSATALGQAYCVEVTSQDYTQASTECPGVNDTYTIYTFTLKNNNGTVVTAPSNVTVTFDGFTNFPGGGTTYEGVATITAGNSSTTATVYTYQALDGSPGCGCPCPTTVSIDTNTFAATIAAPNTVTICSTPGTANFTITNGTNSTVQITDFNPAWFTIDQGTPSSLTSGNSASGTHSGYNGNWGITIGSGPSGCLVLYKNEGVLVTSIAVTGAGMYTFTGLNILSTDEVTLYYANSCP